MKYIGLRSLAIRLAAYPTIAYLIAGAYFYFAQSKVLFPAPQGFENKTPADQGLRFEDLRISVNAKEYLHGWWIPAAMLSEKTMLVLHGNGYVLEDMVGDELASLHGTGANLLLIDYRGYGSSTLVRPDEQTIDKDAEASLGYLLRERRIPVSHVLVLGRSIGSGPATYLAVKNPGLSGLILESPFSSVDDAAGGFWYLRLYPTALLLRTHFDNLTKIRSVRSPLLIVSGTADTLTPAWMADKLFAQAHEPKRLYMVPGAGHNDLPAAGGDALERVLENFVRFSNSRDSKTGAIVTGRSLSQYARAPA